MKGVSFKEISDGTTLLFHVLESVHGVPEVGGIRQSSGIPTDMLACHAHAQFGAVEMIEIFQMGQQDLVNFEDIGGGNRVPVSR